MLHPVLYIELKQVARAWKSILFLFSLVLIAQTALGDYGHLINLFIVFPAAAGALGTGLLSEEYTKNSLKYLYTLPIRRWQFIFIKVAVSISFAAFLLLLIYILKWLIPPRLVIPPMMLPQFFNLRSLLMVTLALSFYNYSVCMFVLVFLKSPKISGAANYLSVVLAVVYLLYCFLDTGYKYSSTDYVMLFSLVSVILLGGGFYLFTLRNPFLNSNPRYFMAGVALIAVSISGFVALTQVIIKQDSDMFDLKAAEANLRKETGLDYYAVSPDGEFVFVQMSSDPLFNHSYVLDARGQVAADLGKNSTLFQYDLVWQFNHGKRMIVYKKDKPLLSEISVNKFVDCYVLDIDSQRQYEFEDIGPKGPLWNYNYNFLNCHTMELFGFCSETSNDQRGCVHLFKQNVLTGSLAKDPIPNTEHMSCHDLSYNGSRCVRFFNQTYMKKPLMQQEDVQSRFCEFDTQEKNTAETPLPKDVYFGNYEILGDQCIFIERLSNDNGYTFRLVGRTVRGDERVYLFPEDLPQITYRDASEGTSIHSIVRFQDDRSGKWLECYYSGPDDQKRLTLLDADGHRVDMNMDAEFKDTSYIAFAPGGMRFAVFAPFSETDAFRKGRIYDIAQSKIIHYKDFEMETSANEICFLNSNTLLYVKNPTPNEELVNNRYLMRFDLDTLESTRFVTFRENGNDASE